MERKEYKVVNGTSYSIKTRKEVIDVLESVRESQTRVIIEYGNTVTGEPWLGGVPSRGRVGRSNGEIKIPILLYSKRSYGGGAIIDNSIIGIRTSAINGTILYKCEKS